MSHAERPGAESRDQAARTKRLIRHRRAMKRLQSIAGGIAKRDQASDKALVRERAAFALHGDARLLQPSRQRIQRGGVFNLPSKILSPVRQGAVEHQALLAIIHAEGTRSTAAIDRFHAEAASGQRCPIVEPGRADAEITECPDFHERPPSGEAVKVAEFALAKKEDVPWANRLSGSRVHRTCPADLWRK